MFPLTPVVFSEKCEQISLQTKWSSSAKHKKALSFKYFHLWHFLHSLFWCTDITTGGSKHILRNGSRNGNIIEYLLPHYLPVRSSLLLVLLLPLKVTLYYCYVTLIVVTTLTCISFVDLNVCPLWLHMHVFLSGPFIRHVSLMLEMSQCCSEPDV